MKKIGVFKITFEKTKKGTKKRYLYLNFFTYSNTIEYLEKSKKIINLYRNLSNVVFFEYDTKEKAYITYNTSKKIVRLQPIKNNLQ